MACDAILLTHNFKSLVCQLLCEIRLCVRTHVATLRIAVPCVGDDVLLSFFLLDLPKPGVRVGANAILKIKNDAATFFVDFVTLLRRL